MPEVVCMEKGHPQGDAPTIDEVPRRVGASHCGQYRSNKENVRKSQVRESEVEMMRTFTAEARTDAFDDAAIETQTAWCKQRPLHHQRSVQIRHHGVKQRKGGLKTQKGRITEGLDTEDETEAVRIGRGVETGA